MTTASYGRNRITKKMTQQLIKT